MQLENFSLMCKISFAQQQHTQTKKTLALINDQACVELKCKCYALCSHLTHEEGKQQQQQKLAYRKKNSCALHK